MGFVPEPNEVSIDLCRRFYAEEIRVVAGIGSSPAASRVMQAFARVPREAFLGPPPWQIASGASLRKGSYRHTTDVRDLYHDVFVALKSRQALNNGQPSLIATLIGGLGLEPGKSVLHVGCGTGYYTAILAEVVGFSGSVIAVEIDADLAQRAAENLRGYPQVKVLHADGANAIHSNRDAILVNAGVNYPHPSWLSSVSPGGVLVIPLLLGPTAASSDAMAVRIVRPHSSDTDRFSAEPVLLLTIYPSPSLRDATAQERLNCAFESHRLLDMRSLRMDAHVPQETCVAHASGFCLSALQPPRSTHGPHSFGGLEPPASAASFNHG